MFIPYISDNYIVYKLHPFIKITLNNDSYEDY